MTEEEVIDDAVGQHHEVHDERKPAVDAERVRPGGDGQHRQPEEEEGHAPVEQRARPGDEAQVAVGIEQLGPRARDREGGVRDRHAPMLPQKGRPNTTAIATPTPTVDLDLEEIRSS